MFCFLLHPLYKIYSKLGYHVERINHLGDWGTQFGKLIVAYKKWGSKEAVEENGIDELMKIYVKFHQEAEKDDSLNDQAREWFVKMEQGDEEALSIWQWFKDISLVEYKRIYKLLGMDFDHFTGESFYRDKTHEVVEKLQEKEIQTVLSTSCSLLHVPYTLKHETKLSKEYLAYFAFAEEKLTELKELGDLAEDKKYFDREAYKKNHDLFAADRKCENVAVKNRLSHVTEADYIREPKRSERQKLQKEAFGLPELPTTTIGSFPQTKDVKANRSAFRKGEITRQEYVDFNKKKIAECVAWQEEIGLDVLVHGEYERNDMVEYFGEALGGFLFTEKAWVQSYGTRCVKPPIIWGDVYREKSITVDWSVYAQSLTNKIMKGMLTGPVTILNWSFPREDISIKESISQIALAIRDEVLDLEANGIRMIQIDEAALREKLPLRRSDWYTEYLDFAIPAFRLTHSGVKADTQIHTHMCYSEFTDIIPAIDDMDADVITFEASRSDLQILDSLRENHFETEVGPGVYDIHSPRVPSVEEIVLALKVMLTKISREKLWVNPDCGLKTRGVPETDASLRNMVEAAKEIRKN